MEGAAEIPEQWSKERVFCALEFAITTALLNQKGPMVTIEGLGRRVLKDNKSAWNIFVSCRSILATHGFKRGEGKGFATLANYEFSRMVTDDNRERKVFSLQRRYVCIFPTSCLISTFFLYVPYMFFIVAGLDWIQYNHHNNN